jgi:hypothetical protein
MNMTILMEYDAIEDSSLKKRKNDGCACNVVDSLPVIKDRGRDSVMLK